MPDKMHDKSPDSADKITKSRQEFLSKVVRYCGSLKDEELSKYEHEELIGAIKDKQVILDGQGHILPKPWSFKFGKK